MIAVDSNNTNVPCRMAGILPNGLLANHRDKDGPVKVGGTSLDSAFAQTRTPGSRGRRDGGQSATAGSLSVGTTQIDGVSAPASRDLRPPG
jgi:hypothetical protein